MPRKLALRAALARRTRAASLAFALAGCGGDAGRSAATSATPGASGVPTAAPVVVSAPVAGETPITTWEAARTLEPAALAVLANQAGAARLVEALDDPANGDAARAALGLARDAELAIGPLARRARAGGARAEGDLEALVAVLSRTERFGERLDPDGEAQAVVDLGAITADAARPGRERGLAGTALGRLAERGLVKR